MSVFTATAFDNHEKVVFVSDKSSGLRAIIAVHNTRLGAAVGGCRMLPYASEDAAIHDALRLSRGMTYKSALAGLPLGGGKSVIIGDPSADKSPELRRAFAGALNDLGGAYIASVDSGTSVDDLREMGKHTKFVSGLNAGASGGDPSPSTARGVFESLRTAVAHRLGSSDLDGLRVAVQGLGHVGYALAASLRSEGAEVFASDISADRIAKAEAELGVQVLQGDDILDADVDVFAPCALGGILNSGTIPRLRAGIVAGAANNQLATDEDGARLADRGILYCPDFLINAGGIIDVHLQQAGVDRSALEGHLKQIVERLEEVLRRADQCHLPTGTIAERLAEEIIERGLPAASAPTLAVA